MPTKEEVDDFLAHHGVLGMHWGVRKDKKWAKRLLSHKGYLSVYNHAADKMNNGGITSFNAKPAYKNLKGTSDPRYGKYVSDYEDFFAKTMEHSLREMGNGVSPSGRFVAHVKATHGGVAPVITIKDTQLQHADGNMPLEFTYELSVDTNGYFTKVKSTSSSVSQSVLGTEAEDFIAHYGVLGMHWGIRHTPGVSNHVNRMAAKDAHEHARAKLFYGEGAGNRRKLVKAKVEYNRRNVPGYGKAFDAHSANQNLSKHSIAAVKQRHRTDRADRNKKRIGAVARQVTGQWGTQAAFVALAAGGVAFARSAKGKQVFNTGTAKVRSAQADFTRRQGARHISDVLKNMK